MTRVLSAFLIFFATAAALAGAGFRAGVAHVDITPPPGIWLSGYASRTRPADSVAQKLWAKALVLDDGKKRAVIVTTDLIGLPRAITDLVSLRVIKEYNLDRAGIVFNSSHIHSGPVIRSNLTTMFDLPPEQEQRVREYTQKLIDDLATVIGAAIGGLEPAQIAIGHGSVGFAVNRREPTAKGIKLGVNANGPVDHDVPVIRIAAPDGQLRAVLFAYACHNTTLGGDFYQISGDWAGAAQSGIEAANPGTTALFLQLCGGDANPNPRGTLDLAMVHGRTLAEEVNRVLRTKLQPLRPPIRAAYKVTELEFAPHTREQYERDIESPKAPVARRAKAMLKAYAEGVPIRRTPYPVQAIRFDKDLTLLALGGEVVVDYSLRAKREYGKGEHLIVAGYSNDVMCYIPSLRVLKEGGYEVIDSMVYYGQPGPFNDQVEELVFDAIHSVMERVGRKR
jgi:neutral ceramidase